MNEYNRRNFKELYGSQLPPILTDKKFIEFIKKYLTVEGFIPSGEVEVRAGNDIRVDVVKDGEVTAFYVSYEKTTAMSHVISVTPGYLEYGTTADPGDIAVKAVIKKGSRDLISVTWGDITPPVDLDRIALSGLSQVTVEGKNASPIDGTSVRVAADGTYSDTSSSALLTATIGRRSRYFWGTTPSKDSAEAAALLSDPEFFKSSVGNRPITLNFDPGYNGLMYRCFVLPEDEAAALEAQNKLVLLDSNIPTHDSNTTSQTIQPNPDNGDYLRPYRFVFSSMAVDVKSTLTTQ